MRGRSWKPTRSPPGSTTPASGPSMPTCATQAARPTSAQPTPRRCAPSGSSPAWRGSSRRSSHLTRSPGSSKTEGQRATTSSPSAAAATRTWLRQPPSSRSSMPEATRTSIEAAFDAAAADGRAALMPYLMGGFPDRETATAVAQAYVDGGADLIELGVPFSDPLADGPVIHAADTAALEAGATLESVLETCAAVSDRVPVAVMAYVNMIMATGYAQFAEKVAAAGAAGVIVPDVPLEERGPIAEALQGPGLPLIPLVAPNTPAERRAEICATAQGFVYLISTKGVTGEREALPPALAKLIEDTKAAADVPVAVGFGISTAEQAATVGKVADGVIIGTRLVREIADAADGDAAVAAITSFLSETRASLAR